MRGKADRVVARKVSDRAAPRTFFVKMRTAITFFSDILIDRAIVRFTAELLHRGIGAKSRQMPIRTASAALSVSVDRAAKLVRGKLSIGIARQKFDQRLAPVGLIGLFGHSFWSSFTI